MLQCIRTAHVNVNSMSSSAGSSLRGVQEALRIMAACSCSFRQSACLQHGMGALVLHQLHISH